MWCDYRNDLEFRWSQDSLSSGHIFPSDSVDTTRIVGYLPFCEYPIQWFSIASALLWCTSEDSLHRCRNPLVYILEPISVFFFEFVYVLFCHPVHDVTGNQDFFNHLFEKFNPVRLRSHYIAMTLNFFLDFLTRSRLRPSVHLYIFISIKSAHAS